MKRIVCENQCGETIEFAYDGNPLRLSDTSGFSEAGYTVSTSKNSGQDGETYNGETANKRNPIITADIFADYQAQRDRLYSFFQPRSIGTVYYYEDDSAGRKAGYYVEKINVEESGAARVATISLICPDPKWYALEDQLTQLAVWKGCIKFPLRLPPQINASGQSVTVTAEDSITDYDKVTVTGAKMETGSGTKSPDNPYVLTGTTKLTVSDGTTPHDYVLPQTLYSLPNGVCDSYDIVSGTGMQNIKKLVLNGTESWGVAGEGDITNGISFYSTIAGMKSASTSMVQHVCDKLPVITYLASKATPKPLTFITAQTNVIIINVERTRLTTQDSAGFKAWLAANPVTMLYQLTTPITITGTAQQIPIHHPTTTLSVDVGTVTIRCRGKFAVTQKINSLIGNVHNNSAVSMGLTVKFTVTGTVVNPSLYDVNRHELMQVNTTMHAGDIIIITTGDGNKRVKLISGGVTTNINNLMAYPPKWLQAYQGDNIFRYNAVSGIDSLSVSILSTQAYWGA